MKFHVRTQLSRLKTRLTYGFLTLMKSTSLRRRKGSFSIKTLSIMVAGVVLGLFLVWFFLLRGGSAAAWYSDSWGYRKKLTIDHTKVSGDGNLTDFPVLISLTSDTHLSSNAQADGDDIMFTDSIGNQLAHEIESYSSGTLVAWVQVPTVYGVQNTDIYMYYGNSTAGSQENATGVWDSNYKGVWHLGETVTDELGDGSHLDSTSNSNNATQAGNANVAGKIGIGQDFDGADDYINANTVIGDFTLSQPWTVSGWVKVDADNVSHQSFFSLLDESDNEQIGLIYQDSTGYFKIYSNSKTPGNGSTLTTSTWFYVSLTWDGSQFHAYKNGQLDYSVTPSSAITWNLIDGFHLGDTVWLGTESDFLNGQVDEIKVSSTQRSVDWIATEYENQNSPSTFYSTGYQEERTRGPSAYWKFDEGYGTSVNDSSGNSQTGTLGTGSSAPTWRDESMCVSGKCMEFDGTEDYVQLSDNAILDIENELTISLWIKPTALQSSTYYTLVYKGNSTNEANYYFQLYGDELNFGNYESGSWRGTATTNANIQVNQWSHTVVTYSNSSDDIDFYVNGLLKTDNGFSHDLVISGNNQPFYLGSSAAELEFYEGFMDEVKIYPYVRSADEIKQDFLFSSSRGSSAVLGAQDQSFLTQGLVGYWNMEGIGSTGSGVSVTDQSGNGNDGTTSDANGSGLNCISAGKYGGGCDLDGTDDSVNLGSGTTLDDLATDEFSVQAWVYLDTAPASNDDQVVIISKGDNTDFKWHLSVRNNSGSTQYNATLNNVAVSRSANTTIVGGWHHVIMTYDDSTDRQIRIYVDGSEVTYATQIAMSGSYSSDASKNLRIGSHANEATYWDGKIDEVRIYNRELSAAEVRSLYQWAPGPVAYWDMDESSGSNANDKSGNGNTGSLQGGSSWVTGKYGGGLSFDGSGDYISAGSDTSVDDFFDGGGTVSFWVYPRSAGENGFGRFLHKSNSTSIWATGSGSGMDILMWQGFDTSGSTRWTFDNVMTEDTWNYITLTYDNSSTTNDPSLYVNSIKKTLSAESTPPVGTRTSNASSTLVLGSNGSNADSDSILDEFRIYNYARTQSQIIEDMNAGHPLGGSPVGSQLAYWNMDEGYGDLAHDTIGSSDVWLAGGDVCPGDTECPTWTNDGKFGKALSFDGGDLMEAEMVAGYDNNGTDPYTATLWFKSDTNPTNNYALMGIVSNFGGNQDRFIQVTSTGVPRFYVYDGNERYATGTTVVTDNSWHHLAGVFEGTTIYIYVDGELEGTATTTGSENHTNPYVRFSHQVTSYYNHTVGTIDEAKIYTAALTKEQILLDMNQGRSMVLGAQSTGVGGTSPSNSSARSYCIPGDTSTCNSPVLELNFEEATGQTAYDTSTNGNNGTLGASTSAGSDDPIWSLGPDHKAGNGVQLDGTDDYVRVSDSTTLDFQNGSVSVSMWVYWNGSSNYERILSKANTGSPYHGDFYLQINGAESPQEIIARFKTGSGTSENPIVETNTNFPTNQWVHVSATFNTATNTSRLFINGALIDEDTSSTEEIVDNSGFLCIGCNSSFTSSNFSGKIDDVKIFDYARTPAQIAWEYSKGAPIAHYRLDECQGTTANDSAFTPSGTAGNNGTINAGSSGNTTVGTCTSGSATEMWANGASGQWEASLDFDETDDRVVIPDMDIGQESTISFWFNSDDNTGTGYQYMYSHGTIQTANSINIYFNEDSNGVNTPGAILVSIMDSNDGIPLLSQDVQTQTGLSDSSWHHLVVTITSTGTKAYVDGVQQISYSNGNGGVNPSGSIYIGARNDLNSQRYYDGKIDDVRIYNYALTTTQITELYKGGSVTFK